MKPGDYIDVFKGKERVRRNTPPLHSRILEKAAREQLAGPFAKLGRYALKKNWGIAVPGRRKNESPPLSTCTKGIEQRAEKPISPKRDLFRRLLAYLKRRF